jgi:hypothetical protein
MKDKLGLSGEVEVTIIKADKNKEKQVVKNAVHVELKNAIAKGLQETFEYGINNSPLFSTDNFDDSPAATRSGMVLTDASNDYETALTTITTVPNSTGVRITSSTRRDGDTKNLTGARCGRYYVNGDFTIDYASTTFTQAVTDGQQIDVTWDITIS